MTSQTAGIRAGGRRPAGVVLGEGDAPAGISDWHDLAACHGEDQDAFFPLHPNSFAAARGKSICAGCPVLFECANWAADHPDLTPHGTWGGMTEWERFPRRRKPEASNEAKNRRRKVAAMRSRGVTISVIARELDVSIALVQKDIVRLKMTTQQKKHTIDDAEVARLIELGWSQREIARKMGVDTKTIWRSLHRVPA